MKLKFLFPISRLLLRQDSVLHLDAYNSSLYKQAVLSSTPVVYIQKFVDRHIVPTYVHSSHLEDHEDDNDDDLFVSDDDDSSSSTTTTSPPPMPEFVMQTSPPAIYLSKSVKLWQNDKSKRKETIVAVSGVELAAEFWKDLLCNTTDCEGGDKYLSSYLIDTSGYVLASNR